MAFHEIQFPTDIARGSRGGPGFNTGVVVADSGHETRTSRWANARRVYDVRYGVKGMDDLTALQEFFIARMGAAHGFRFKDYSDFATDSTHRGTPAYDDHILGTGDGSEVQFQLRKEYASGTGSVWRTIEKPVSGTVKVSIDDVEKTEGTHWSVNTATGIVTFDGASIPASAEVVKAGCEFDVPVRFGEDVDLALPISWADFEIGSIDSIPLVEIWAENQSDEDFFYGGSSSTSSAVDITIALSGGRLQAVEMTAASKKVTLPDPGGSAAGGPRLVLKNSGSTNAWSLRDQDDVEILSVGTGVVVELWILKDSANDHVWVAI